MNKNIHYIIITLLITNIFSSSLLAINDNSKNFVQEIKFSDIGLANGLTTTGQVFERIHYIPIYRRSINPEQSELLLDIHTSPEADQVDILNIELNGIPTASIKKEANRTRYPLRIKLTKEILKKNKDIIKMRIYTQDHSDRSECHHTTSNWTWSIKPWSKLILNYDYSIADVSLNQLVRMASGEKEIAILLPTKLNSKLSESAIWLYAFLNQINDLRGRVKIDFYENIQEKLKDQDEVFSIIINNTEEEAREYGDNGLDIISETRNKDLGKNNYGLVIKPTKSNQLEEIIQYFISDTANKFGLKIPGANIDASPPYIPLSKFYHDGLMYRQHGENHLSIYANIGSLPQKPSRLSFNIKGKSTQLLPNQLPANFSVFFNEKLLKSITISQENAIDGLQVDVPSELIRRENLLSIEVRYQGKNPKFYVDIDEKSSLLAYGKQNVDLNFQEMPWNLGKEVRMYLPQTPNIDQIIAMANLLNIYWTTGPLLKLPKLDIGERKPYSTYLTVLSDNDIKVITGPSSDEDEKKPVIYNAKRSSIQLTRVDKNIFLLGRYQSDINDLSQLAKEVIKDNKILGVQGTLITPSELSGFSSTDAKIPKIKTDYEYRSIESNFSNNSNTKPALKVAKTIKSDNSLSNEKELAIQNNSLGKLIYILIFGFLFGFFSGFIVSKSKI